MHIWQVSPDEPDAFFIKFRTQLAEATFVALLQLMQDVRLGMLRSFGSRAIDFDFHAVADGEAAGWFVVTLAPL
eukprot:SAG11_NODE_20497_length_444_cov_0.640580_1_plen_73_part_10